MQVTIFENVRALDVPPIQRAELLNLGKINVICGKNNSGKSTLLRAIQSSALCGRQLNQSDINRVFVYASAFTKWSTPNAFGEIEPHQTASLHFRKAIQAVADRSGVLFANDGRAFALSVKEEFDQGDRERTSDYPLPMEGLEASLREVFKTRPQAVLLPPKRTLEEVAEIVGQEPFCADGKGILRHLFFCKNQDPTSDAYRFYEQLAEAFEDISDGHRFNIFQNDLGGGSLNFALRGTRWLPAPYCGLGLQDLLVILFFALHKDNTVVMIEEPESHLHPDMQRRLVNFLREKTEKQYFMTTHSSVFLNSAFADRVFFTTYDGETVTVDDATSRAAVLADLGYSVADNLVSDLIILVEGPKDTPVIEEFLIKLDVPSKFDVKMWPLGGDIMADVDLSVFVQNYRIIALVDQDPGSGKARRRFIRKCERFNIPVVRLERYAIENYFSIQALRKVFGSQIPSSITSIEPDKPVNKQIGINVKNENRKIAREMTLDEIEGTDLLAFFKRVQAMLQEIPGESR